MVTYKNCVILTSKLTPTHSTIATRTPRAIISWNLECSSSGSAIPRVGPRGSASADTSRLATVAHVTEPKPSHESASSEPESRRVERAQSIPEGEAPAPEVGVPEGAP